MKPLPAAQEVYASLHGRFTKAPKDAAAALWMVVVATGQPTPGVAHQGAMQQVELRIPLASKGDAYGESRSCSVGGDGQVRLRFDAGLDEKNFIEFAPAGQDHDFRFLLNKYLCRALAAPFQCGGLAVQLPRDMKAWRFTEVHVQQAYLDRAGTAFSRPVMSGTAKPFDYARCAVIAPSNGMCCVQHKTTEWHCGGTPAGDGWHQVSGDCFHRETGGTCSE